LISAACGRYAEIGALQKMLDPPSAGRSSPMIAFSSVDFPAPFGPAIAVRLPAAMLPET
jgi:hypothetical protein